jgi:hypothetical protein
MAPGVFIAGKPDWIGFQQLSNETGHHDFGPTAAPTFQMSALPSEWT